MNDENKERLIVGAVVVVELLILGLVAGAIFS